MQDIYEAVSQNRIAALQLDTPEGMVTHSVQIHRPFHIPDLAQASDGDTRGLWLTTANSFVGDEAIEETGYRDKNFALLLLDDEKKIVAELQSDPDETSLAMIEFVRHCKPTLSYVSSHACQAVTSNIVLSPAPSPAKLTASRFHQVAQQPSNILTLTQVRKFAEHFIFWRRAIAIPPLHARDMYIVSPNCDLAKLPQAAAQWARQFPFAPALPNFLADLSVAPRPYKMYCPSKAHRPVYMIMLAWLMRGGWVTQLCTFAYVVVWPEIVYEVEHALEAEEIARAKLRQAQGSEPASLESLGAAGQRTDSLSSSGLLATTTTGPNQDNSDLASSTATLRELSLSATLSPQSQPIGNPFPDSDPLSSPSPSFKDDPLSPTQRSSPPAHEPTPAEQAAEKARLERIADKAAREIADRAMAHARRVPPARTAHPSVNSAPHLAGIAPHIILDAKKATGKESRYLTAIGQRLREGAGRTRHQVEASSNGRSHPKLAAGKEGKVKDKDVQDWDRKVGEAWPLFWKYFNGRSALERIALQEEMKRKEVWTLLTAMSEYLLCARHW